MNQKRKAELQRKLSMAPVPRPPDDLADRIKRDIPEILNTRRDRERLSQSVAFNIRVAASILLLVSSAFLTMYLLSRGQLKDAPLVAPKSAPAQQAVKPQAPAFSDTAELNVSMSEPARHNIAAVKPAAVLADLERGETANELKKDESADRPASSRVDGITGAKSGAVSSGAVAGIEPATPPPAAPAVVAASAPEPARTEDAAKSMAVAESITESITLTGSAQAAALVVDTPRTIFGISVDPDAFTRVKEVIESGEKPPASAVDVGALVNYFAGVRPAKRDIQLDVEASRPPLVNEHESAILRYTIDTESFGGARRPSPPPIATNIILQIEIDGRFVESYRVIGGNDGLELTEPVLLRNASVTGLVELKLKPRVRRSQTIASIRFRYRSVADGRDEIVVKNVRARDVERSWLQSTRRHRLATLGAVWGESLRNSATTNEVAKTAERLATEAPGDSRARELAAAATAFSRLQSSAPTGSGR